MTADNVTHLGITYANHDGVELQGDLYLPKGAKAAPALVAVHGGGWVQGVRAAFQYWGPYLAARGYAVFAISYRLATKGKTFPQAVQDVLAGVQFVRGKAGEFGIDAARIGLLGASAGGHLASLAALSGKKFTGGYPQDPFAGVSTEVKALVGVYGVYDMVAMWTTYQIQGGIDNNIQKFLGASPMENRQLYFDATSTSYATFANNKIGVLLVTGTQDDLVDPKQHTEPFQLALKQAGFFVRPCIVHGAPHYWMNDPIEEPTSYSGFLAPRLLTLPRRKALARRLLLLQQQRAFLADQRLDGFGNLGQEPGQHDFEAHMVVEHVDGAARGLRQRRDAELQAVVGPGFFLEGEELAEFFLGAAQAGFQPAHRFVAAEPVRDGDNQRLAH